jgi:large subunit ribosomal protein L22
VIIMPQFGYSFQHYDKAKHVRASIREKDISHKHSREIAVAIKGKSIEKARELLENVISKTEAIPYRRYNNEVAHRSNIRDGFFAGRFPKKAAYEFLRILDNLESNAEYKGMDLDRLRIVGAAVHKGTKLKRFQPRAMGRSSPKFDTLVHVEVVAQEANNNG